LSLIVVADLQNQLDKSRSRHLHKINDNEKKMENSKMNLMHFVLD